MGAGVGNILLLLLVSIVIATPLGGWMMYRWLQEFAYRIPLGPWIFLMGGGMTITIALVTISFQSVRAALTNPVDNLRTE